MSTTTTHDDSGDREQQLRSKRRRTLDYILPSMPPSIQYCKSVSGEEFEDRLKDVTKDVVVGATIDSDTAKALANSYSWQSFWKLMLYIFGCSPWDLETWGLRLDRTEKEKTARLLVRLLPHPVWERRVDILRYVLQKTVGYRLKSDLKPLGPLAPGVARGLAKATRDLPDASSIAFTVWEESNPGTNPNIARLLQVISKKAAALNGPSLRGQAFILKPEDVIIVNEALDVLSRDVLPPYTVDQYWDSFVRHHPLWPGDMAPYDAETIARWDKLSAAEKEHRKLSKKPNIPPTERENNEKLAYWSCLDCSYRISKMMTWSSLDGDSGGLGGTWL